jgi:hypothetical protein
MLSFTRVTEEKPERPESIAHMLPVSDSLDLHPAPGEPRALRVTLTQPGSVRSVVARAPGWVRVLEVGESSMALAWVPEAQLTNPPRLGRSHRTRPPHVHRDYVMITGTEYDVLDDALLFAGSTTARIEVARILKGARVRILKRDGMWVSIAYVGHELVAGQLGAFWIEASALGEQPVDSAGP